MKDPNVKRTKYGQPVFDVSGYSVEKTPDGFFRFVSHDFGIATHGFRTPEALQKYAGCILATDAAIKGARNRYREFFGGEFYTVLPGNEKW